MTRSRHRLFRVTAIPAHQVSEHRRLSQLLEDMQDALVPPWPEPLAGMQLALVRRVMADIARLVSREPGNRALLRLPPGETVARVESAAALRDGEAALAAFHRAHSDIDSGCEDGWLVAENRRRPGN
ncbi:MAG: hypothetical protein ABS76_01300 [Pelagibacterium sp. SCN 64-44]|nr:MAG: hypothetical protein ABS76_01300 [Pelagibacterium sp. SCN 64-44]